MSWFLKDRLENVPFVVSCFLDAIAFKDGIADQPFGIKVVEVLFSDHFVPEGVAKKISRLVGWKHRSDFRVFICHGTDCFNLFDD
ncbi:MAG TPA: hypothetical protein VIW07_18020 [Candidatus Udaeobacter sp.]